MKWKKKEDTKNLRELKNNFKNYDKHFIYTNFLKPENLNAV
jgi:hypothetical protein